MNDTVPEMQSALALPTAEEAFATFKGAEGAYHAAQSAYHAARYAYAAATRAYAKASAGLALALSPGWPARFNETGGIEVEDALG
jgi:hypothetical protein